MGSLLAKQIYSRFDVHVFSYEMLMLNNTILEPNPQAPLFDEHSVVKKCKHCKIRTSTGPDNISSLTRSNCAEQLGPIFNYSSNLVVLVQSPTSLETDEHLWIWIF